jgi:hypothetical protein
MVTNTITWHSDNSMWSPDLWTNYTPSSWVTQDEMAASNHIWVVPSLATVTSASITSAVDTNWVWVRSWQADADSSGGTLTAGSWWHTVPEAQNYWVINGLPELSKAERFRERLRSQMDPALRSRSDPNQFGNVAQNEIVALQLLKSMVSTDRWRKYLKHGFVDVVGRSGLVYQITRGKSHVRVFRQGERLAELCVVLKNRHAMPPTDEVITRMLIAESDESDLWRRANVYGLKHPRPQTEEDLARIVLAA